MGILNAIETGVADVAEAAEKVFGTAAGQSAAPATVSAGVSAAMVDVENVIKAFEAAAKIDWSGGLKALRTHDWAKAYTTTEEIVSIVGLFVPGAAIAADDMKALEPLVPVLVYVAAHSKQADANSPVMQRAAGQAHVDI